MSTFRHIGVQNRREQIATIKFVRYIGVSDRNSLYRGSVYGGSAVPRSAGVDKRVVPEMSTKSQRALTHIMPDGVGRGRRKRVTKI